MRALFVFLTGLLTALFLFGEVAAQPNIQSTQDRWNDMPLSLSNYGVMGAFDGQFSSYPCHPESSDVALELPAGSGQEYGGWYSLWIGAIIDSGGYQTPRVSVAMDGWDDVNEMFSVANEPFAERSRRDTTNCLGQPIYDPNAIADHEFVASFEDTLSNEFWVHTDDIDGPHRPLGLRVTRTTYSMIDAPCNHIYWIQYRVENIGQNVLRDVFLGHFMYVTVWRQPIQLYGGMGICGYDTTLGGVYVCENDGRTGESMDMPNSTAMVFLATPQPYQRDSFNWWISNGYPVGDFGPSWEDYCQRDSLGLGWTAAIGTPMGDLHKYQLMGNGEHDYAFYYLLNHNANGAPPQGTHAWCGLDSVPDPCTQYDSPRCLFSRGPFGTWNGNHTELHPGEYFNVWMAIVGGLNLHDPNSPQPQSCSVDPGLYDFTDLITHADEARQGSCLNWLSASPHNRPTWSERLDPVYPNPFNSTARIRFELLMPAHVDVVVYDVLGQEVQNLLSRSYDLGEHEVSWNAEKLASGIYFVQARANDRVIGMQKAVLLK